jgi:hypothetical protein
MREYEENPHPEYAAADGKRAKKILWGTAITCGLMLGLCCLSGIAKRSNWSGERALPPPGSGGPRDAPPTSAPFFPSPSAPPTNREFTVAEVAQFEQYERDRDAGVATPRPFRYFEWRDAGRPVGNPALSNATQRSVNLTLTDILACRDYNRAKNGSPPPHFDDWVKAGKPVVAGTYRISNPSP